MSVQLPRAVREAEERSNALAAANSQQASGPDNPTPAVATEAVDPSPAAPTPTPAPDTQNREDWKARYYTLQGKYNAEVPVLQERVKQLQVKVDEMTTQLNAKPATPAVPAADEAKLIGEFGEETVGMVNTITSREIQKLREEFAPHMAKVEAVATDVEATKASELANAKNAFLGRVTGLVPNWQAIDARADFQDFLKETEPASGQQWGKLLYSAAEAFDDKRAAFIFNAFKTRAGIADTRPSGSTAQDALAAQVVPASSGSAVVNATKKIWTASEINEFYKQVGIGKKYTAAQAAELEADLLAAQKENRIQR